MTSLASRLPQEYYYTLNLAPKFCLSQPYLIILEIFIALTYWSGFHFARLCGIFQMQVQAQYYVNIAATKYQPTSYYITRGIKPRRFLIANNYAKTEAYA